MTEKTFAWGWLVASLLALVALVAVAIAITMLLRELRQMLTSLVAAIQAANRREVKATEAINKVQAAAGDTAAAVHTAAKVAANVAIGAKEEIKQVIRDEIQSKDKPHSEPSY